MVDLTEAGLLQQNYEEPVGKDRVDQQPSQPWVLKTGIKPQYQGWRYLLEDTNKMRLFQLSKTRCTGNRSTSVSSSFSPL